MAPACDVRLNPVHCCCCCQVMKWVSFLPEDRASLLEMLHRSSTPARSLLTMRVASASDSTSSAMISSGFCVFSTPSRIGMSGASLCWAQHEVQEQLLINSRRL
jgi:hypothetical protein